MSRKPPKFERGDIVGETGLAVRSATELYVVLGSPAKGVWTVCGLAEDLPEWDPGGEHDHIVGEKYLELAPVDLLRRVAERITAALARAESRR